MCAALEEMRMDSKREGIREGKIEGAVKAYKEVGFSLQKTIQRIAENYNFSLQQAEEEVKKYWQ